MKYVHQQKKNLSDEAFVGIGFIRSEALDDYQGVLAGIYPYRRNVSPFKQPV